MWNYQIKEQQLTKCDIVYWTASITLADKIDIRWTLSAGNAKWCIHEYWWIMSLGESVFVAFCATFFENCRKREKLRRWRSVFSICGGTTTHKAFHRDYLLCLLLYDIEIMTDKLYDFMSAMGSSERGFSMHCIECIAHTDVNVHVLSSAGTKARDNITASLSTLHIWPVSVVC